MRAYLDHAIGNGKKGGRHSRMRKLAVPIRRDCSTPKVGLPRLVAAAAAVEGKEHGKAWQWCGTALVLSALVFVMRGQRPGHRGAGSSSAGVSAAPAADRSRP
jgi:hypothetical protein